MHTWNLVRILEVALRGECTLGHSGNPPWAFGSLELFECIEFGLVTSEAFLIWINLLWTNVMIPRVFAWKWRGIMLESKRYWQANLAISEKPAGSAAGRARPLDQYSVTS